MGNSASASRNEEAITSEERQQQLESSAKQDKKVLTEEIKAPQKNGTQTKKSRIHRTGYKNTSISKNLIPTEIVLLKSEGRSAATAKGIRRTRQASAWSLGSLSGHLNWSFTAGANRSSFHNRNKFPTKSLTSTQQRRSKTQWHKPLTNVIFNSHFKDSSRNEEFHITHLVAKGAFGIVFKVIYKHYAPELQQQEQSRKEGASSTHSYTAPIYALKLLKKSKVIQDNSVQQIKNEADIQKLCGHHPFIVQQVDSWQNRRNLHILSEYVPNGELFSKLTNFSLELIRVYLAEIALAIDFLHNAGVIYRDVKPENILLTSDFHIKLTDFGLSKWLRLGATTRTMCGTFQYMAPEVLRVEPYGHAADWWSLGILVCQMLLGTGPDIHQFLDIALPSAHMKMDSVDHAATLTEANMGAVAKDVLTKERKQRAFDSQYFLPSEVEELPHEAKDVLKRLLEVNPKQRLRSVLSLQKIALYKNFKIDSEHLLNLRPIDMISADDIASFAQNCEDDSIWAEKAFHNF